MDSPPSYIPLDHTGLLGARAPWSWDVGVDTLTFRGCGHKAQSRRHMWAAGMASIRLPSMMPGLRMEKGTVASGGLETWSILEGMPGWAGLGQWSELQRMEKASLICRASRGRAPECQREDTPPPRQGRREEWKETSSQFPGGKQQNTKIKISILNDCSTANLLLRGIV